MPVTQISAQEFRDYQNKGLFKNTIYDTSNQVNNQNNQNNNQTNNQNNVVRSSVRRTGGCSGCGGR
jgi:hypothetical protein